MTGTRRIVRLGSTVVALGLGLWVTLTGPPAWSHAALVSTSPTSGQNLEVLPDQVDFTFNEEMSEPAYVVVTAPDGSSVTEGDPVVDGSDVTQDLGSGGPGGYTMAYRVVSTDGHPITGQIRFTVGGDSGATSTAPRGPAAAQSTQPGAAPETAAPRAAAAASDGFWARHRLDISVGAGLFLLAGVLLALSRRAT